MIENIMLGIHAASSDGILPLTENEVLKVENRTYAALRAMPIPKLAPVPPRTLRAERDTPISVRM